MPALLHPGNIIRHAHLARPANWSRSAAMNTDYTRAVTDFLAHLSQRRIPFVIVGGIALLQHVRGRNTEDIDLIIAAPDLLRIPGLQIGERDEMFALCHYRELRVDILLAEHPLFLHVAAAHAQPMTYEIGVLPTATIDGLILLKLFALPSLYRQFDLDRVAIYESDILQLLSRSTREDTFFLQTLHPHLIETDLEELRHTLADTRARLARLRG